MPTTIKLRNSVTTTSAPSSLVQGEVAINITDKKVWVGNAATTPIQLLGDGGSGSFTSIAFGAGTVSSPSITFTGDTNTGIYSPAADTIAFTEGGVESMRIDSSGNVGIGTSSPTQKLTVDSTISIKNPSGGAGQLLFSDAASDFAGRLFYNHDNDNLQIFVNAAERMRIDSSGNVLVGDTTYRLSGIAAGQSIQLGSRTFIGTTTGGDTSLGGLSGSNFTAFLASGTERMRIDSSGNVGIGTSSPTQRLHVVGNSQVVPSTSTGAVWMRANNASDNFYLGIDNSVGDGFTGTAYGRFLYSNGAYPIIFYTNSLERMRITSGGELLVGTTDTNPNSGNGVKINAGTGARTSVVGSADTNANFAMTVYSTSPAAYRFQVGYGGTIYATSTSITAISDATLKTNVKDLETGLTEIMALQPRRFDWINGDATNVAGFIAQEVQQVLPDLVEDYQYSDNETKLGLKMGDILPTLVKAIQEQQAMIEELKQEVALLKSK